MRRLFLASVGVLAAVTACQPKPVDPAVADREIRDVVKAWNGYLQAHNDSAIGALYVADAVLLPPNMPRVTGAENIRRFFAVLWPAQVVLTLEPVHVGVSRSGEVAIEEGNYTFTLPGPTPQTERGKYLVSWWKTEQGWRITRDMWNSDDPPVVPPAPAPAPAAKR